MFGRRKKTVTAVPSPSAPNLAWESHRKAAEKDLERIHKDGRKAIEQNLIPGEPVLVVIRGAFDQALVGTDRRVLVFKRGSMGGARGGTKVASWDYRHIHGVQIEHGKSTGLVMLAVAGTEAKDRSYWDIGKDSVHQSPYGLSLTKDLFDQAQRGVVTLRHLVSNR